MPIYKLRDNTPFIDPSVFIAPDAIIIGDVTIGRGSSIWFHCVARGDIEYIKIGEDTNIQDLTMMHMDIGKPLTVGNRVTVGHSCVIHGCTVEDDCLIGMGSKILSGAVIGTGSIIAAGTVILEGTVVPPFSLYAGIPGKIKKSFDQSILERIRRPSNAYKEKTKLYKQASNFIQIS